MTEDEMVGWHHRLNGLELEQTPGDSEGQEKLVCCSPQGHKEFDMTEQPNSNNKERQSIKIIKRKAKNYNSPVAMR